jgi:hypothetical protein
MEFFGDAVATRSVVKRDRMIRGIQQNRKLERYQVGLQNQKLEQESLVLNQGVMENRSSELEVAGEKIQA